MSLTQTPTLRLTLPARAENIAVVRQALSGLAARLGASVELVNDLKTAVSEAATNVVAHAYPEGEEGPLEVCASLNGRALEVVVRDTGMGIHPRPVDATEPSLRVGLALIGALADRFEVSGEEGKGTEVRLSFDLYRGADSASEVGELVGDVSSATQIAVRSAEAGGAAIPKVLEMLVARSGLTLDQLSDVQVLGDYLADWNSDATIDGRPMQLTIDDSEGALDVRIGPLDPGLGRRMLDESAIPGLGNTLDRVAGKVDVEEVKTDAGPAEYLVLEIRSGK